MKLIQPLTHIKITRKVLYISVGTIILLSLFVIGAVSQVRAEAAHNRAAAVQAAKIKAVEDNYKRQITALETALSAQRSQNIALTADKQTLCNFAKPYAAAKTARATARCL